MYKFYCDETLFYVSGVDDADFYMLSAKLSLERGKTGALAFSIPHTNIIYDRIQKLKSIITVFDGDEEIFRGRVLYDEKDFYNRKTITCEGELAFLLDSVQRPYEHKGSLNDFFSHLVETHNSQVESIKQFKVGDITVIDNNDYISVSSTEHDNTYNVINDKLIKSYGGYLRVRTQDGERYIDYVKEYGEINDQVIEFGVNLLDIKEYITAEDVFTCLIPLGQKDSTTNERVTIKTVNGGLDYLVNQTGVELFGKIWAYKTWDDVTLASNLKRKGEELLNANIEMSVTLTLKAVDLHLLNINTKRIKQGDKLRVVSLPHNLDKYFECTKIDIDILNSSNNEYTFGSSYKTLTSPSEGLDDKTVVFVQDAIKGASDETMQKIVEIQDTLTQEELMSIITNNGEAQGVYLVGNQLWINGNYIDVDKLSALCANLGRINAGTLIGKCFELDLDKGTVVIGKRNNSGYFEEQWLVADETGLVVGGNDGNGGDNQEVLIKIVNTSVTYGVTDGIGDGYTTPTQWFDDIPVVNAGQYLWTKTVVEYSDGQAVTSLTYSKQGIDGLDGVDTTIKGNTPPSNTSNLWLDTSVTPNILKYYNGIEWTMVNDPSEEYENIGLKLSDVDKQFLEWCYNSDKSYINGGKIYAKTITANQLASNSVTTEKLSANSVTGDKIKANSISADKINVKDLFAQTIESTGSIKGVKFISEGNDDYGYPSKVTMDSGKLALTMQDGGYQFDTNISAHHAEYVYTKPQGAGVNTVMINGNYIRVVTRENGTEKTVLSVNADSGNEFGGAKITDHLLFSGGSAQSAKKGIKWEAINSKNPYVGYATDQVDGTFVLGSLLGTNYASGLAIGGGSGNLLYKGNVVLDSSNYSKYSAKVSHTHDYAPSKHYHDYAPTTHTHIDYASIDHEHIDYASIDHEHSDYALNEHEHPYMADNPSSIESESDALNINGVIVTKGSRVTASTIWKTNSNYPVYGCRALYANASGTTGTVTLSESAENFKYLIIVVGFSDTGASGTVTVWSPNGKTIDVGATVADASNASIGRVRYAISGTTLTASSNYVGKISSGSYSATQNKVYCKAVLGFK